MFLLSREINNHQYMLQNISIRLGGSGLSAETSSQVWGPSYTRGIGWWGDGLGGGLHRAEQSPIISAEILMGNKLAPPGFGDQVKEVVSGTFRFWIFLFVGLGGVPAACART